MTAIVVKLPERPWPSGWEQDPRKDTCGHDWETVYVEERPHVFVELDRCRHCCTPRCDRLDGYGTQCLERRHHRDVHVFESGTFEPVGGVLDPEPQDVRP